MDVLSNPAETKSLGHSKNETIPNQIFEKPSNGWTNDLSKFESNLGNNLRFTNSKDPNPKIALLEYDVNGLQKVKLINGTNNYETTMTNVRSLPLITDMLLDQSKT